MKHILLLLLSFFVPVVWGQQVEQFKKMENKLIPDTINYDEVHNLRNEAVQKLKAVHPHSVGQASRISGVSPSDISVLIIYMEQMRHKK